MTDCGPKYPRATHPGKDQTVSPSPNKLRGYIDRYRKIRQIGEGTYGRVYLCEERVSKQHVAIKKVLIDTGKEGFPQTAVREIKLLAALRHDNVVRLLDIVTPPPHTAADGATIFMVFEYLDHDLAGLLRDSRFHMTPYLVKWLMKQLVEGLQVSSLELIVLPCSRVVAGSIVTNTTYFTAISKLRMC